MSLDYCTTECKMNASDCNPEQWDYFKSIVFGTIATGIGDLRTEEKARKFYVRYSAMYYVQGMEPFTPWEFLRDNFIGLTTNATPMTELQFTKRLGILALDYANAKLQQKPSKPLQSI